MTRNCAGELNRRPHGLRALPGTGNSAFPCIALFGSGFQSEAFRIKPPSEQVVKDMERLATLKGLLSRLRCSFAAAKPMRSGARPAHRAYL